MVENFKIRKINQKKSLSEKLVEARKRKDLSLKKVEKETKIKIEYLNMLEGNDLDNLPDDVYVRGFLRSLANLYQIDQVKLIDCYRQSRDSKIPNENCKVNFRNNRIKKPVVLVTPRLITISLAIVVGIALLSYLWLEVSGFAVAPKLILDQPEQEEVRLDDNQLKIEGTTDKSASITINKEPIPVSEEGKFKENIKLQIGYNLLNIEAKNQGGKTSSKIIKIVVEEKDGKISKVGE